MRPERPLLRLVEARLDKILLAAPACSASAPGESAGSANRPRPPPRRPLLRVAQLHPGRRRRALRDDRGDRLDLLLRPVAEEGEGDVQRLGRDRPQRRIGQRLALPTPTIPSRSSSGRSSATNRRARGLFSLSLATAATLRGEDAREQHRKANLRATTSCLLSSPSSMRSRCIPTRAERSRMSRAAAGDDRIAGDARCRRRGGR